MTTIEQKRFNGKLKIDYFRRDYA